MAFDQTFDVVVVGSGAAGMITAWAAARQGLDVVVVEKSAMFGGNTALSGGGSWLPTAPLFERLGEVDDPEEVFAYLRRLAPGVDPRRHRRYLDEIPRFVGALEQTDAFRNGFHWIRGYSDYHPELGGNELGRGLWANPIDERALGAEAAGLRRRSHRRLPGAPPGMWLTSADYHDLIALRWGTLRGPWMLMKLVWRAIRAKLLGEKIVTSGAALATRLRLLLKEVGVPVWTGTPLRELIRNEAGAVVGAVVEREGRPVRLGARRGVMLAAGGFEGSAEWRQRYQPLVQPGLTGGSHENTGDGIAAGMSAGAATDMLDDSWWMPGVALPAGMFLMMCERSYPHQFIVNGEGRRFVNEAAPYTDFGHALLAGQRSGVSHFPYYMIIDSHAWKHYFFGGLPSRPVPREWIEAGIMVQADTMEQLAGRIGVPAANLVATAERYNGFARQGRDEDFHRGESSYDRWYGNPKYRNPNLGEVRKPPFLAFRMVLSDLGTKGGLLTNEHAQVLDDGGAPIAGLYAAGNNSASIMGNSYAGPGSTLGPAMTFGWVAANHMGQRTWGQRPAAGNPAAAGRKEADRAKRR